MLGLTSSWRYAGGPGRVLCADHPPILTASSFVVEFSKAPVGSDSIQFCGSTPFPSFSFFFFICLLSKQLVLRGKGTQLEVVATVKMGKSCWLM